MVKCNIVKNAVLDSGKSMESIRIDGQLITPVSARSYQELIKLELNNHDVNQAFPYKLDTPRYSISVDDVYWGYYKVLSKKQLANNQTSILSLHKQ